MSKYISFDIDDPKISKLGDVISNQTARKILDLVAEEEQSASEIAAKLKVPINTVGYNLEKLENVGLIEKSRSFWIVKGKKMPFYRVANKKIIISPRKQIKGIIPAVIVSGVATLILRGIMAKPIDTGAIASYGAESSFATEKAIATSIAPDVGRGAFESGIYHILNNASHEWIWFFIGAMAGLLVFLIWNWRDYLR